MKCKPYSKITVEIRTQLKTVKITSNIFAVHMKSYNLIYSNEQGRLDSFSTALVHSIDSIFVQRGDDKNVRVSLRMHEIRLRDAILRRDS